MKKLWNTLLLSLTYGRQTINCGKGHPEGCTHPDANQNTSIPWNESVYGMTITRLKGPGDSLDIKHQHDAITGQLVTLDYEALSKLRKGLPNSRRFTNSAVGETISLHTICISRQPPSQPPVTQLEDRLGGGNTAPPDRRVHDSPPQCLTVRLAATCPEWSRMERRTTTIL